VVVETLHDLGVLDDTVAQVVFTGPLEAFGFDFDEFFGFGVALRAFCRRVLALIDIATYEASEFLFHDWIQLLVLVQDTKLFLIIAIFAVTEL
jgi:hypothetical protein